MSSTFRSCLTRDFLSRCLAVELQETGKISYILPILVGKILDPPQNGRRMSNLMKEDVLHDLPEIIASAEIEKVKHFFEAKQWVPTTRLRSRTVKSIVDSIMMNLGVPCWNLTSSHGSVPHERALFSLHEKITEKIISAVHKTNQEPLTSQPTGQDQLVGTSTQNLQVNCPPQSEPSQKSKFWAHVLQQLKTKKYFAVWGPVGHVVNCFCKVLVSGT